MHLKKVPVPTAMRTVECLLPSHAPSFPTIQSDKLIIEIIKNISSSSINLHSFIERIFVL